MKRRCVFGLGLAAVLFALSATPSSGQVTISGSGSGASEAPPVSGGGVAFASCTLNRTAETIVCQTRVFNIVDLTAAHLHLAGPGTSGSVVIPLPGLPLRTSGSFAQTFTLSAGDLIPRPTQGVRRFRDLLNSCAAGNCYLNYHTTRNRGGEIRVQLCPASREANTFNRIAVCTSP